MVKYFYSTVKMVGGGAFCGNADGCRREGGRGKKWAARNPDFFLMTDGSV